MSVRKLTDQEQLDRIRKLITDKELAAHLRESVHAINRWRRDGVIPYVKLGYRTMRYNLEAVEAALLRRQVMAKRRASNERSAPDGYRQSIG